MTLRAQAGFTLVELLVGLSIAVILLVLAVPLYTAWVADGQVSNAAATLADGIRFAQAEAIKRNTNVEFSVTGNGWTVQTPGGAAIKTNSFHEGASYPSMARTPGTSTTVTFNSLGMVETANAAAPTVPLASVGLTMAAGTHPLTGLNVLINNFGRVKICDPRFAWPDPKGCPP